MTTVAVIPARYASTRFCGKALANETGKYLIQHVHDRVRAATLVDRAIVATDDERIASAVRGFGGEVQLTRPDHPSGTDRVAEVAARLNVSADDLVINVQGDEPEIEPSALDRLIETMREAGEALEIGTLAAPFAADGPCRGPGSPLDPNCVKVVVSFAGEALYFSRSLVPFPRQAGGIVEDPSRWLLHLGVYAFRAGALQELTDPRHARRSPLAEAESLEQLGWLESGRRIGVVVVEHPFVGIDTPEDYAAFVQRTLALA